MMGWFVAGAIALAASTAPPQSEMTLIADTFDRAQITQDRKALDRMTDEALIFVDGSGKRMGKTEFVSGWMGAEDRFEPVTLIDRTFTPLGRDAFIASAETTLRGTSGGRPFTARIRFSDTFRRVGKEWRAVHIHVTRMQQ